jgi:hypothetical protein
MLTATLRPSRFSLRVRSFEFTRDSHELTMQGVSLNHGLTLSVVRVRQLATLDLFTLATA